MSKGSWRRPSYVSDDVIEANWPKKQPTVEVEPSPPAVKDRPAAD